MSTSIEVQVHNGLVPAASTDEKWRDDEQFLTLRDGRTLAYTDAGNPNSSTVFLHFHEAIAIGSIRVMALSPALLARDVHYIAPTLPGWGNTSRPPKSTSFATCVMSDVTALLEHLHPDTASIKLYISGIEYGSLAAQILYCAPYAEFPHGRQIASMLLRNPYSPKQYNSMSRVSPPLIAQTMSSTMLRWIIELVVRYKMRDRRSLQCFWREQVFDKLTIAQKESFNRWTTLQGREEEGYICLWADQAVYSVSQTWDGFRRMESVLRWSWGTFDPLSLDKEHAAKPILIASAKGRAMSHFLVENYPNVRAIYYDCEFEVDMWSLDRIMEEFMGAGSDVSAV